MRIAGIILVVVGVGFLLFRLFFQKEFNYSISDAASIRPEGNVSWYMYIGAFMTAAGVFILIGKRKKNDGF